VDGGRLRLYYSGCQQQQLKLIQSIAMIPLGPLISESETPCLEETADLDSNKTAPKITADNMNLQNIVKVHFLEKIFHDRFDTSVLWDAIGATKLKAGLNELFGAFSSYNNEVQQQHLRNIDSIEEVINL
jgi:hypothetical protein